MVTLQRCPRVCSCNPMPCCTRWSRPHVVAAFLDSALTQDHERIQQANLTKAVEDLLIPYLQHDEVARIRSGFEQGTSRGQAVTGWSLGDREKNPSNLFLVVEVGMG